MTDRTSDGIEIKIGLRVMTNNLMWGTVTEKPSSYNPGWWGVTEDGSTVAHLFNGERMAVRDNIRFTTDPKGI